MVNALDWALRVPGANGELAHLGRDWPEEVERYRRLFAGRAYLPGTDRESLRDRLAALKRDIPAPRCRVPLVRPEPVPVQLAFPV